MKRPAILVAAFLAACGGGGGPDFSATRQRLQESVNLEAEGNARITKLEEASRTSESDGGIESMLVKFTGELEFSGPCTYHMEERKKGERLAFDAEVEFLKEPSGWKQVVAGIHPR